MADTVNDIAYDEASKAIASQASVLDNIRARAATLVSVSSLITAFLGGQVLARPKLTDTGAVVEQGLGVWGWLAVICFGFGVGLVLAMLWPREFKFVMGAKVITASADVDPDEVKRSLAIYHESNYDSNEDKLGELILMLRLAIGLLALQSLLWLIELRY